MSVLRPYWIRYFEFCNFEYILILSAPKIAICKLLWIFHKITVFSNIVSEILNFSRNRTQGPKKSRCYVIKSKPPLQGFLIPRRKVNFFSRWPLQNCYFLQKVWRKIVYWPREEMKNAVNHRLNSLGFASGISLPVILSILYFSSRG